MTSRPMAEPASAGEEEFDAETQRIALGAADRGDGAGAGPGGVGGGIALGVERKAGASGAPRLAWSWISPMETTLVAVSIMKMPSPVGMPMAMGLVPIMARRPPQGWTRASLVVMAMRHFPASATRSA